MKLTKNFLAIIVCFLMFLLNFSVIGVSADSYTRVNAFTDDMGYTNFSEPEANGWSIETNTGEDDYVVAVIDGGNIKYDQVKTSGTTTSEADNKLTYVFPKGTVVKDESNRTRITTNQYKGIVELDITYAAYVDDQVSVSSYYQFDIFSSDSTVVWNSRVYGNGFQNRVMGTGNNITTVGSFTPGADRTAHYVFNTDTREATASADGVTKTATGTVTEGKIPYLSKFTFTGNRRMGLDSYVTFKNVAINVTPSFTTNEKAMFASLPAKLTDDVNNVKGNITIPEIDGVTWTTSNADIIALDGTVTRIKDLTRDVTLTATFAVDGITYNKEYDMTVAKYVTPVSNNMGYTSFDDAKENGWSMQVHTDKENYMEAIIENGYIKYNQVKCSGLNSADNDNTLTYKFPKGTVIEDESNRTRITTNQYKGIVDLAVTYAANIEDVVYNGDALTSSYYHFNIYSTNSSVVWNSRIFDNGFQNRVMNAGSNITTVGSFTPGADRTAHYIFNTDTLEITASADGVTKPATGSATAGQMPYISKFALIGSKRMGEGSYVTFKDVTINVTPSFTANEEAMFASLPAKLVSDVDNVSTDVVIPEIDGVQWSTSNADIIALDGTVTKIKDRTQDVTLTATFAVDGITYNKEYDMTVAPLVKEITVKNFVKGTNDITMDVNVSSPETLTGKIFVALYNEKNAVEKVRVYDAISTVKVTLDSSIGKHIKVFWLGTDTLIPLVEHIKIDL